MNEKKMPAVLGGSDSGHAGGCNSQSIRKGLCGGENQSNQTVRTVLIVQTVRTVRKRMLLFAAISLILIALILPAVYLKSVVDYKKAVREISFHEIDIAHIPDGVYIGEYDVNFIYAKVEVAVQDGEITGIDILEHKNERGKSAESVIDEIMDEQKIDVDAISGATNSSAVIKKAIENALEEKK